jgi:outer membrane lipoprotein-sorting protein
MSPIASKFSSVFSSTLVRRWMVPALAAVAVLAGGAAVRGIGSLAAPDLAPRSAEQVLASLQNARPDGLSGTIEMRADLGLPELPGFGGGGALDINTLLAGSHTLKVWYSGPDSARLALIGQMSESSIITNGKDVWTWSSKDNAVTHSVRPAGERDQKKPFDPGALPVTPEQAAARVLGALGPSTTVTTDATGKVAGRPVYELVLAPKDTDSLVGQVRIAVDSAQNVPMRVQVIPRGATTPALEVGFTSVEFSRPAASWFTFTPPPGAKVTETAPGAQTQPKGPLAVAPMLLAGKDSVTIGSGWTAVMVSRVPVGANHTGADDLGRLLRRLPRVDNGRVLGGSLFNAMLTDDGRLLVGAVSSAKLQAVAKDPAAQPKPAS